ncbi:IclR family transcriptional regulator [Nocardioides immobilis]|uniref:IclR family transcriptional regulator n=1 Tax=Nocardioides immobilis TaxID=2049295 RepID=A0A417Y9I1_9ACTN|nr:IclR family transcriptional regulator [Nocardioides immobilis]RHW29186.1 IclR family transcriptional regulator [Nocardioides immobilis]
MAGNRLEPGRSTASRLLSVLDVFSIKAEELSLVEIADRAAMPVATTYRLLGELTKWGALERLPNRRYRVGLRLWEVGSLAPRQRDLREVSRPFMQDLYEATHENVQVGVPEGNEVLIVEMVSGRSAVPTVTRVGGRLPLHATAVGKVTLAFSDPDLLARTLQQGLPKLAPRTLTMPRMLIQAVEQARQNHFAFAVEEMTRGASSVASPVLARDGTLIAAIALVVRASADLGRLAPAVRTSALALSRELQRTR